MIFFAKEKSAPPPVLPDSERLPLAVIGVGHLGQHHVRLAASIPEAKLIGVADLDLARARKLGEQYETRSFADPLDLADQVKAVVISTPTPAHYALAKEFLSRGVHCFVEKPLTEKVEQAEELIDLAKQKNLILQVGHVERFNPAVVEMARQADNPVFIEANRLGPYDPRVSHIGVVLDLMIHDIDIVLALVKDKVIKIEALGAKVLSDHEDIVKVTLFFSRGCRADLTASRVSLKRFRKIRLFQKNAYMSLDYAESSLKIYRKKKTPVTSLLDLSIARPRFKKEEPLMVELRHFVQCVREGKAPMVSGEHGRDALEIALAIRKSMALHAL